MKKPKGYWSYDKCKEEALKYNTIWELGKIYPGAYNSIIKNKWQDDIFAHIKTKKLRNYWSEDECKKISLKYKTRKEFSIKSPRAYQLCLINNWIDSISHLEKISYTKEYCLTESKKYDTLKNLIKNDAYLYKIILNNNWSDELFSHFNTTGNKFKRCIYCYNFSDNYVYVGLTYNLTIRNNQHMKNGPIFNHIKKTKLIPIITQLTDYININDAKNKEKEYVDFYKKNGFNLLNKSKTGGLGGNNYIWTKEKCKEEALKYNTRKEYLEKSTSYFSAYKNKWLDEICSHMTELRKTNKYWSYDRCLQEAKNKKTKKEFRKSIRAYSISLQNNWINDIYLIMNWSTKYKTKNYYNIYDNCLDEAKKYKTSTDFIKKSSSAYKYAIKNNFINKLYMDMNWKIKLKN